MKKLPLSEIFSTSILEKEFLGYCNDPDIKVISFDIFDTLVLRKVAFPHQVFLLMGRDALVKEYFDYPENFHQQRVLAEQKARKISCKSDITLDEIYDEFNLSENIRDKFKQLELTVEEDLLLPNPQVDTWLKYAHLQGKKIICLSDMYLSTGEIKQVALSKLANAELIHHLYVSNENDATKNVGDLFQFVLNELKLNANQLLHIGDHPISDRQTPAGMGIHALHYSTSENFQKIQLHEYSYVSDRDQTFSYSRKLSLFANPYEDRNRQFYYEIGASVIGPVLYGFSYWLLELAKKKNIVHILTAMREGRVFKPCLDFVAANDARFQDIRTKLLYVSRKSLLLPFLEADRNYFRYMSFSVSDLFEVFGLDFPDELTSYENRSLSDAEKIVVDGSNNTLFDLISDFIAQSAETIKSNAAHQKKLLLKYLSQQDCSSPLLVDFGGGGSILKELDKLENEKYRPKHFALMYRNISGIDLDSLDVFLPVTNSTTRGLQALKRGAGVVELLLNGNEKTTLGYSTDTQGDVVPVFPEQNGFNLSEEFDALDTGIQSFFNVFHHLEQGSNDDFSNMEIRQTLTLILSRLIEYPTDIEAEVIGHLPFEADCIGNKVKSFSSEFPALDAEDCIELLTSVSTFRAELEWVGGALERDFPAMIKHLNSHSYIDATGTSHDIEQLVDILNELSTRKKQTIAIWGAGEFGQMLIDRLKNMQKLSIDVVVDTRANVEGFTVKGMEVKKPVELLSYNFDVLVIASAAFKKNIIDSYYALCKSRDMCPEPVITC